MEKILSAAKQNLPLDIPEPLDAALTAEFIMMAYLLLGLPTDPSFAEERRAWSAKPPNLAFKLLDLPMDDRPLSDDCFILAL